MSGYAKERAGRRIAELAACGLDLPTFWREAGGAIAGAVPHLSSPCWFTLDPASLLATSHFQAGIAEIPPEWLAHEYLADDVHKMADVARSPRGISTLHEATGGEPQRSPAYNEMMRPNGVEQELLLALRTRSGEAWGVMGLYRAAGEPLFGDDEHEFLRAVAPHLAAGAQRGLLVGEATEPEGPQAPGLVVLDERWSVESLTPGVERWLDELPDGDWERANRLPSAVLAVAGQALRSAEGRDLPGEVALARVLSRAGRWIVLHGAALAGAGPPRVAVIIEPAHPARIASLLMSAYGLSEREQDVTRRVLRGHSTAQIASELCLSPNTVQQHLKSVFEKTGVRSRRDLVGTVFFSHYEPRVRDNERRVEQGAPVRGGPAI